MKCIDLDDTGVQHKQEGWLYIGFMPFLMRKHHFIGDLGEVTPLYWLFECEGMPFYGVNLGGGWWSFFISVQNYTGGWLEFHVTPQVNNVHWILV